VYASQRHITKLGQHPFVQSRLDTVALTSCSDGQASNLVADVVAEIKAVEMNATVTGKDRGQIDQALSKTDAPREELLDFATESRGWTLSNGNMLDAPSPPNCPAPQSRRRQKTSAERLRQLEAMVEEISARDRAAYLQERRQREEVAAREAAYEAELVQSGYAALFGG
jgi:hypothetical protein